MNSYAIEVQSADKIIAGKKLLDQVTLMVDYGSIVGLVGRNGSGKTVLFKCICGFMKLSSGTIKVMGKEIGKNNAMPDETGIIIEAPGFVPGYSGFKNLSMLASINRKISKKDIYKVIEEVGLDPEDKKKVKNYSMGMKQRLAIAQAIMEDQKILILDEPLNGLDDNGIIEMRKLFIKLKEQEKTILIASHMKEDIDYLCDSVYRMDRGILKKVGSAAS